MRRAGLQGLSGRPRYRRVPNVATARDHVQRQFGRDGRDQLWVTEHPTREGNVYCAVVLDAFSRRVVEWPIDSHQTAAMVTNALGMAIEQSDSGPEFVAKKVQEWIEERGIGTLFIERGSPWQNGHNESFNGVFRDGCLNRWLFESVREAREATEAWLYEYNVERPHGSLGGRSPALFFEQWEEQQREAA